MADFRFEGHENEAPDGRKKEKKRHMLRKLFRLKKRSVLSTPIALTDDQKQKIVKLSAHIQRSIGVEPDPSSCQRLLEIHAWNLREAVHELQDFQDADDGILVTPNPLKINMLGSENDQLTSCYIDALLFSMYATTTVFDPLLVSDIEDDDFDKRRLQTNLRLFVNRMREGYLIRTDQVRRLREALVATGWEGVTQWGNWAQEDSGEFFLHLTNIFGLPFLPFHVRLYHGANKDTDDDRVMTERSLALPIPTDSNAPIALQEILVDMMYSNMVTGIKRSVLYDEPDELTPSTPSSMNKAPIHTEYASRQVSVAAWQVLELLPFYSGMNEQGERIPVSNYPDGSLILPMVLKRYTCDMNANYQKIQREVVIPQEINFERFLNQNMDNNNVCDKCGQSISFVMRLRSAVCHRGDSPFAGHYISYACVQDSENDEDVWLKFDDMNLTQRVKRLKTTKKDKKAVFQDLASSAYMVFYELDRVCNSCQQNSRKVEDESSNASEESLLDNHTLKDKINALEVKASDGRTYSCNLM
ncbi:hypothetical protein VKS41_004061 [Umbelopsis sp. WA50703]